MDIFLLITGFLISLIGIAGAFIPGIPGPLTSWIGLLLLHLTNSIPTDWNFLFITLGIAIAITVLDYVIPAIGTKKFGGSKYGVWGAIIGLFIGMLFLGPLGMIIGPFIGALIAELIHSSKDTTKAFKAAVGSFIGFVFSTLLKLVISLVFFYYYIVDFWDYKSVFFSF